MPGTKKTVRMIGMDFDHALVDCAGGGPEIGEPLLAGHAGGA